MSAHTVAALIAFGVAAAGFAFMVVDSVRGPRARRRRADVDYVRSVGRQNGWRS